MKPLPNYKTKLYRRWYHMICRCRDAHHPAYKWYGARGIVVCERWKSFPNFRADMEPSYVDGLTLDRKDNNGNYEPANCRWANMIEQNRNRRDNRFLELGGRRMCLKEWANDLGVDQGTIAQRLARGLSLEAALKPRKPRGCRHRCKILGCENLGRKVGYAQDGTTPRFGPVCTHHHHERLKEIRGEK